MEKYVVVFGKNNYAIIEGNLKIEDNMFVIDGNYFVKNNILGIFKKEGNKFMVAVPEQMFENTGVKQNKIWDLF